LVLDTDVVVAAMRSPGGASAALITLISLGHGTLLMSSAMALEYEAVCCRNEHARAVPGGIRRVREYVDDLLLLAEEVKIHFNWRPLLPDPSDELVLAAAINGRADGLVSFNTKHFQRSPERFGIALWTPGEALRRMRTKVIS
jgi:predicted nucleic acid-binding protein